MNKEIVVTVTTEDLDKAIEAVGNKSLLEAHGEVYANHCVIATAVTRQTGKRCSVEDGGDLSLFTDEGDVMYKDGVKAAEIVDLFDGGENARVTLRERLPITLIYKLDEDEEK